MNIVILDGYTLNPDGDNPWTAIEALGKVTVYDRTKTDELFYERAMNADILLTNKTPLRADRLAKLPKLRCIGVLATGYDVVDVVEAGKRGIPVMNVPAYGVEAVVEHLFALLLELCRRTSLHDASVRVGEWTSNIEWCYWKTPQLDLYGKTMGIYGFGNIGKHVGKIAHAFGMEVLVCTRSTPKSDSFGYPCTFVNEEELFRRSQILSLHCPLTEQTRGLVNAERIATMPDGAILLNLARGPVIDEQAVADALHAGKLGGFAADVASVEPIQADNPLLTSPHSLLTPHLAWGSQRARRNITAIMADKLQSWINGTPKGLVNAEWLA